MNWGAAVVVLGALIIVTRARLIFQPTEAIRTFQNLAARLMRTDARVRGFSVFYAAFAVVCFAGGLEASEHQSLAGVTTVAFVFGVVYAGFTVWALAAPASLRSTTQDILAAFARSPAASRTAGVFAVLVGSGLIYLGAKAL